MILFDLTHSIYQNDFKLEKILQLVKLLEKISNEKRVHVFLAIRFDLLSNEYLYLVPRVLAIHPDSTVVGNEELISRLPKTYPVSFMYKATSSKLEIENRLLFSLTSGFCFKSESGGKVLQPVSNADSEMNLNIPRNEAMILVEDSDRDSEDEMEADADF